MAPMTGMELLQRVRADERTSATPFVMVANDNDEGATPKAAPALDLHRQAVHARNRSSRSSMPVIGAFFKL